ncbi:MAG: hypothetical protein QOJ81_1559 [Chloroflexota bacterium]|jgi:uncharacterized protein YdhG (YjbR/CyaY superfamily)|nr:hypothetical protein [Chloroflexota bacterium]
MAATKTKPKSAKVLSDVELDAMKETLRERKAAARWDPATARAEGEKELLAKIAEMKDTERAMAERIHAIVTSTAPDLTPKTYYGMPAWATPGKDGKVICFFQPASKFKVRYCTLGFQPDAKIDDGNMWPIAWALTKLTAADEKNVAALVKKAVG